ncbi:helix-turn-helix transcriptional regulator [Ectopseudomonas toyotomiensis]|uniref:helix-turn-helix transcriptional regulator n=1 Tax=Ectopseudomonas toyotomiensis TaxID=554344 RepID=UPI0037C7EF2D
MPPQPHSGESTVNHDLQIRERLGIDTIIRYSDVMQMTGLSRSTISRRVTTGEFPKPVPLSDSSARSAPVGFMLSEVKAWISRHAANRDTKRRV